MITKHQALEIKKEITRLRNESADKEEIEKYSKILKAIDRLLKDNY